MTPAAIIHEAAADGVSLTLSPAGTIKVTGDQAAVNRWLPVIRDRKPAIVAYIRSCSDRGDICLDDITTDYLTLPTVHEEVVLAPPDPPAVSGELPKPRAPVSLDEALRTACEGMAGISPAQFRALLSPEDVADIEASGIHPKILKAYALSFANHGGAGGANNTRHLLTAPPVSEIFPMTPSPCEPGTDGWE